MSWWAAVWHRLVHRSGSTASRGTGGRPAVKLRDLSSGSEGSTVSWVDWGDSGGVPGVPESGVLEGLTRLGNRLLLRINVDGNRRTASVEWNPPPSVDDVEAVLQANLGAEVRALGHLEVPIRPRLKSSG